MLCNKCGKETQNQSGVCDECAAKDAVAAGKTDDANKDSYFEGAPVYSGSESGTQAEAPKYSQPASGGKYTKMFGFKFGLVATILSVVGLIFANVAISLCTTGIGLSAAGEGLDDAMYIACLVLSVLSLPLAAVGIAFGAKTLKMVRLAKANGVKPIAPLILGIVAIVLGVGTIGTALTAVTMAAMGLGGVFDNVVYIALSLI